MSPLSYRAQKVVGKRAFSSQRELARTLTYYLKLATHSHVNIDE